MYICQHAQAYTTQRTAAAITEIITNWRNASQMEEREKTNFLKNVKWKIVKLDQYNNLISFLPIFCGWFRSIHLYNFHSSARLPFMPNNVRYTSHRLTDNYIFLSLSDFFVHYYIAIYNIKYSPIRSEVGLLLLFIFAELVVFPIEKLFAFSIGFEWASFYCLLFLLLALLLFLLKNTSKNRFRLCMECSIFVERNRNGLPMALM